MSVQCVFINLVFFFITHSKSNDYFEVYRNISYDIITSVLESLLLNNIK